MKGWKNVWVRKKGSCGSCCKKGGWEDGVCSEDAVGRISKSKKK